MSPHERRQTLRCERGHVDYRIEFASGEDPLQSNVISEVYLMEIHAFVDLVPEPGRQVVHADHRRLRMFVEHMPHEVGADKTSRPCDENSSVTSS